MHAVVQTVELSYEDASLVGRVVATVLRGRTVFKDGQPPHAPCGTVLLRRGGAF